MYINDIVITERTLDRITEGCTLTLTYALDYVMEGVKGKLNPQNCSVYQYKGKDIPYTKFNVLHGNLCKEFVKFFKNKDYDNKHMNRYAYDMANYTEESRIKVENMKADISVRCVLHPQSQ